MCTQRAGQVAAHLEGIGGGSNTGSLASEDALDPQPCGGESRPLVSKTAMKGDRPGLFLNVGLTRTRVPTVTPEDDRGEKAEPPFFISVTHILYYVFVVLCRFIPSPLV